MPLHAAGSAGSLNSVGDIAAAWLCILGVHSAVMRYEL